MRRKTISMKKDDACFFNVFTENTSDERYHVYISTTFMLLVFILFEKLPPEVIMYLFAKSA